MGSNCTGQETQANFEPEASKRSKRIKMSESIRTAKSIDSCQIREFTSNNGYRSALLAHVMLNRYIYFEATITSNEGYSRVGFASSGAEINGPIGMDEHGYSFGSKNGYMFHKGKRAKYGERYFKGDIVCCLIFSDGSAQKLTFFVNGEEVSKKPIDVKPDAYHPAVSVCKNCVLSINVGPYFVFKDKISKKYEFLR
ncbi:uncharacterized protein VICG_00193 [Vittaforma corneae ATCC 50505]|uniref:B30.2/SPRY domain-containing protein n=1 Tax=Vittaforma corneae (strain ATCC 50505) TaxID=993615 RepID=L2GPQ7_VITCO|nr:uncharacterized protein VICG_00193 [Vittaforma corneae ATCC 50505]ELA42878.1 hypothetical protein VICG_00193 [Vittaforma corneae ATCC 50505]